MAEEEPLDADLQALRRAAESGDWNACREATRRLLFRLPVHRALGLPREQVARRLPAFERHQPGVTWPRQLIESIGKGSVGEGWKWPQEDDEFPGPGANNFLDAVESLWQAGCVLTDKEQRVEAMVDAILAEKLESSRTGAPGIPGSGLVGMAVQQMAPAIRNYLPSGWTWSKNPRR